MCLYKTHRLPKISRKPIQCYKIFNVVESKNFKLSTGVYDYLCNIGDTIKSEYCWIRGIFKSNLEGEVVHAYKSKTNANMYCWVDQCVCLCEIPPFTFYWYGKYGEIAASKIKIIKRL